MGWSKAANKICVFSLLLVDSFVRPGRGPAVPQMRSQAATTHTPTRPTVRTTLIHCRLHAAARCRLAGLPPPAVLASNRPPTPHAASTSLACLFAQQPLLPRVSLPSPSPFLTAACPATANNSAHQAPDNQPIIRIASQHRKTYTFIRTASHICDQQQQLPQHPARRLPALPSSTKQNREGPDV